MTVIYCGSCGAANGAVAKFCRQCGTDLSSQTAKQSTSKTAKAAAAPRAAVNNPKVATPVKPQLRIVTPTATPPLMEELATPQAAADSLSNSLNTSSPNTAGQSRSASAPSDSVKQMREAKRIEQQQEEDARQIKQAVTGSLSQRLAQAAGNRTEAITPAVQTTNTATARLSRPTGALNSTTGPRIRTAPTPAHALRNSGPLNEPATGKGKSPVSASTAVAEASGLQQHPRAGLFIRLTAGVLGLILVSSGVYFYRHQRAVAQNSDAGKRNLLSSEEESVKLIQVAEAARQKGETEAAAINLTKAIELTPQQPEPRQMLAETYENAGRQDEALKVYDGLLKVAPENLGARLKIADLHRAKGNVNEARQQYQRILALNLHSPEATRALEAIEEIDTSLAQAAASGTPFPSRPRRVAVTKRLGPALPPNVSSNGQVALIPQNPFATPNSVGLMNWSPVRPVEMPDPRTAAAYHKTQGTRFFNIREYGAAVSELHQALKLTPGDKDLYYFLGGAYKGLGQNMKAHEYYKKCDSGPYADTAQNGARQTEKAARKEFERQQKELLNSAKSEKSKPADNGKDPIAGKNFQNSFQEH